MKQSIAGTWIYAIMITFIMIFVAYIAISINYSKTFTTKTHIVNLIEQYQGLNSSALAKIDRQISIDGYQGIGRCTKKDPSQNGVQAGNVAKYGSYVGVNNGVGELDGDGPFQYCVYKQLVDKNNTGHIVDDYYYTVVVFLKFSFPLFGDLYTMQITGETHQINYPNDLSTFWSY